MQICAPIPFAAAPSTAPHLQSAESSATGNTLLPRILLVTAFAGVALFGRLCYLAHPFDHDAACFIYMGKMTADGGRLGHDLVDNKFPTVGLITSAAWRGLGTWWPGYVILETVLSLASAVILGRLPLAISQTNPRQTAGGFSAFCFALVLLNFTPAVFGGFQLETIQIFFATIAAAAIVRAGRDDRPTAAFIAGLAGGCAAMLKPTGLAVLAAGVVFIVLNRLRPTLIAAMAAGLLIPAAVVGTYLSATGLLPEMPALYRQISTYAANSVFDRIELLKVLTAAVVLGFPLLVVCRGKQNSAATGVVPNRSRRSSVARTARPCRGSPGKGETPVLRTVGNNFSARPLIRSEPMFLFPAVWLALELAGVIAQRRMYAYHFLPLVPPAALLFGLVSSTRPVRLAKIAAALGPIAVLSFALAAKAASDPGPARTPVADYLAAHARPGDAVWSEQWPRTILQTGLSPGSRIASTFLFANSDSAGLDYSAMIVTDFSRTRPEFIVLPANIDRAVQNQIAFIPELAERPARAANYATGWDRIRRYTLENYRPVAEIDGSAVYRRADKNQTDR